MCADHIPSNGGRVMPVWLRSSRAYCGDRMRLLDLVRRWWHRPTRVAERAVPVVASRLGQASVSAKYMGLYTYLEHRYASSVVLTFEQLEALLGVALPAVARAEPDWWTGTHSDGHSAAWSAAGRTAIPNLPARIVAFERVS
jgi:hypothetical protein